MDVHGILLNFMECPSGVSIEFHGVLDNLMYSNVSNYTHCCIKCHGIKCLCEG